MTPLDRRSFLRGALGAAGAVALGGCGRSSSSPFSPSPTVLPLPAGALPPVPRPTLRTAGVALPIESPFSYVPPSYTEMTYLYDTLLLPDTTGALIPWLAASHQRSPDGMVHTFEMRDGVRWHDGQPLTAQDVVFSIEYFKSHTDTIAPFVISRPADVERVRANGRTVEITLEKPVVPFAENVAARFPILPRHIWEAVDDPRDYRSQGSKFLVGSGPYRLETNRREQRRFVANDDFFLGRPFVKQIDVVFVANGLQALDAGEIDVATIGFVRPATARGLASFRPPEYFTATGRFDFVPALYWNGAGGGALADAAFRRACAFAIDRRDLVKRLLGGLGAPGNPGFLPPDHPYRVDVEQYEHDPAAAERLLDTAGYRREGSGVRRAPDGKPLSFKLSAPPELAPLAELVIDALKKVGVALELQPSGVFNLGSDYEMALVVYAGISGDPDFMRSILKSRKEGETSFLASPGFANPEFDDVANRQLVTFDEAERRRLVTRMQQIVAAELPILHLYHPTPVFVLRRSVFDDQWASAGPHHSGPLNKAAIVTGVGGGSTEIRPTQ